jgi:signal transduction histidine kinase
MPPDSAAGGADRAASSRLLFGAAVLVPLAVFGAAAWLSFNAAETEAERRAARTVEVAREQALRVFGVYELIIDQVDRQVAQMKWPEILGSQAVHENLRRIVERSPEAGSVFLLAPSGRDWQSSRRFPMPAIDGTDRDYFRVLARDHVPLYVSEAAAGRLAEDPFFAVARRRSAPGGRFDGLIGVSVRPAYFEGRYEVLSETPDDEVLLVRTDGSILVRHPASAARNAAPAPLDASLLTAIRSHSPGVVPLPGPVGRARIYAYSNVGAYPLYVVYGLSRGAVLAQWQRGVVAYGVVCAAAMVLLLHAAALVRRRERRERDAVRRWSDELARREEAESALRHAQRLDALGRLTGGVAHDFNNLLNVIKTSLAVHGRLHGKLEPQLETVERAVAQGARLSRQLLAFARRQQLEPAPVALDGALPAIVELIRRSLGTDQAIETALAPDLWPVHVDRDELELALLNIAVNARDAMAGGGTIRIGARNAPGALGPGDGVVVAVADEGSGIAPEVLDKVFDPFFTTKAAGQGTGLGLSQVYGFVTQSGGRVEIDSKVGRGTEVRLVLPRASAAAAAEGAPLRAPEPRGEEPTRAPGASAPLPHRVELHARRSATEGS